MGKNLEVGVSGNEKIPTHQSSKRQNKLSEVDSKPSEQLECNNEAKRGKWRDQVPNSGSAYAPQGESREFDAPNGPSELSRAKDKALSDGGEMPSLGLTLKRLREAEDDRIAANDDCNVLRHSDSSAFSKYGINN